jgi:tRNA pseudouridine13 synthase
MSKLIGIRYQAGVLLFPRTLDGAEADLLRHKTFPLLAPGSRIEDPAVKHAALSILAREKMTLESLAVPGAPQIHFDPEERPLLVFPGKLTVGDSREDEENPGRLRVNVAFTLPPGAYATLVVKRLFSWALAPGPRKPPPRKVRLTPGQIHEERRRTGFLAKKRARKAAKER